MKIEERKLNISDHEFTVKGYWLDQISDFGKTVDYPVVIICPGGGFTFHSGREEEPLALRYNSFGMHAVVLEYKLIDDTPVYPLALKEMAKTIDWINKQPDSMHIDKDKIILAGFSAGAHLVAAYNGIGPDQALRRKYQIAQYEGQHAAVILGYPVIDMTMKGSFPDDDKILHEISTDESLWKSQDLLNKNSKPAFVWQTRTDDLVNVMNSLVYVEKMVQLGLPAEFHMFGSGIHGLGLATYVTKKPGKDKYLNSRAAGWMDLSLTWLEMMNLLGSAY